MLDAGYGDRIILGADKSNATDSSPGAAALLHDTSARLARHLGEKALQAILVDNPARTFADADPERTPVLSGSRSGAAS